MQREWPPVERLIADRFQRNLNLPLNAVLSLDERVASVDSSELLSAVSMRGDLARLDRSNPAFAQGDHSSLVRLMVSSLKRYLYQRNQYLSIPRAVEEALYQHYSEYVDSLVPPIMNSSSLGALSAQINLVVARHVAALNSRLGVLRSQILSVAEGGNLRFLDHPCYQYSAGLQLAVIGLENIEQPVLDVGCGWDAHLVEYLRRCGVEAYGIDRNVRPSPYLFESDWFEFDCASRPWGTVISHMALSNHCIHFMVHEPGRMGEFRSLFSRILDSLAPGGRFIYAPSLPALERGFSAAGYTVETRLIGFAGAGFRVSTVEKRPRSRT